MSDHLKGTADNKLARRLKNVVRLAKDKKAEKEIERKISEHKAPPRHNPEVEGLLWKITGLEFDLRGMGYSLSEARRREKRNWKWFLIALFLGLLGWSLLYLFLCWRELSC